MRLLCGERKRRYDHDALTIGRMVAEGWAITFEEQELLFEEAGTKSFESTVDWLKIGWESRRIKKMERQMVTDSDRHSDLLYKIHETYVAKNADYGDAFGVSLDKRGLIAAIVRMEDKIGRLDSLKDKGPKVVDESLMDTALDLANYAIMTAMWLEKQGEMGRK